MPPIRNVPLSKPVKIERTHEENQERYVGLGASILTDERC